MYDQHGVFGMVDRMQDLRRRQTPVDGMQHISGHQDGKITFQVPVTVIIHHGNGFSPIRPRPANTLASRLTRWLKV